MFTCFFLLLQKVPSDIQLLAGTAINLVILLDGDHHRYVTTFLTCSQQFGKLLTILGERSSIAVVIYQNFK